MTSESRLRRQAASEPPRLFLCLDLMPLTAEAVTDACVDTVEDLLRVARAQPAAFAATWTTFETKEAAEQYALGAPTLVVIPLVVEFNPVLGY